jgi:hypothetical protein
MVTSSEKGVDIYISLCIRIGNECVYIMYRLLTEFGAKHISVRDHLIDVPFVFWASSRRQGS